jgi:hypothetical protein
MEHLPECVHVVRGDKVQVSGERQEGAAANDEHGFECHVGKRSECRLNGP